MADQPYKRPPITEAVIHVVFGSALSAGDLEKANDNFARLYPQHQDVRNATVEVIVPPMADAKPITTIPNDERGHRRSSDDQTQILLIWPTSLVYSQLAPYPGWNDFFERFVRDWTLWKKVIGYRKIVRLGVRYINRIDIQITGSIAHHEEFLNMYPHIPDELEQVQKFLHDRRGHRFAGSQCRGDGLSLARAPGAESPDHLSGPVAA